MQPDVYLSHFIQFLLICAAWHSVKDSCYFQLKNIRNGNVSIVSYSKYVYAYVGTKKMRGLHVYRSRQIHVHKTERA